MDEADEHMVVQYGAFFSEGPALRLIERLVADGCDRDRLYVNHVAVHVRFEDYEWDR